MTEFNRAFVDICAFIYYLERNPSRFEPVKYFFSWCCKTSKQLVTSAITVEEYCIAPYRDNNLNLIHDFNRFLSDMDIQTVSIDRIVANQAAQIRASFPAFKPMDALQLAAAVQSGCDMFLTNDKQLRQFTGLRIFLIADLEQNGQ